MSGWPTSVAYHDRLFGAAGDSVEIPSTRDDAFDWVATLDRLFKEDKKAWQIEYRRATACCWYTLNLMLSGGRRLDPFTGRVEADRDVKWEHFREMQFDGNRRLDISHRGGLKTHIRGYVGITNKVLLDPNLVAIMAAHERQAAFKHAQRVALEWKNNPELKLAWPDVFFADPEKESQLWNQDRGWSVKRTMESALPTLSYYSIMDAPTGGRVGLYIFDDIEDESTTENDEMRGKLLRRFTSFLDLAGRLSEVWVNGTHHHPNGLVAHLRRSGAWKITAHVAEDLSKPAPDIAKLYDDCNGKWPNGDEIPLKVREVRLDGEPTYLHGLELAQKRLDCMMTPGGIANYHRQYMADVTAGVEHKLNHEHIRQYDESPEDRAQGTTIIMTIDGSRGINDPTVALVWALHPDETCSLVAGLRKKLVPSAFGPAIFNLWSEWEGFGIFDQFRVEIFAQAAYDFMIRSYFDQRSKNCPRIIPIGHPIKNRLREFNALEPMLRRGKIWFPRQGLIVYDETGMPYDLVEYAIEHEIKPFPLLDRDDFVAAFALLGEAADAKVQGGGKGVVGPLPFPADDAAWEMMARRRRRGVPEAPPKARAWDESWWDQGESEYN